MTNPTETEIAELLRLDAERTLGIWLLNIGSDGETTLSTTPDESVGAAEGAFIADFCNEYYGEQFSRANAAYACAAANLAPALAERVEELEGLLNATNLRDFQFSDGWSVTYVSTISKWLVYHESHEAFCNDHPQHKVRPFESAIDAYRAMIEKRSALTPTTDTKEGAK